MTKTELFLLLHIPDIEDTLIILIYKIHNSFFPVTDHHYYLFSLQILHSIKYMSYYGLACDVYHWFGFGECMGKKPLSCPCCRYDHFHVISRPSILIIEPHYIFFFHRIPELYLDDLKRDFSWIGQPVLYSSSYICAFSRSQEEFIVIYMHRCHPLDHNPVFAPVIVELEAQPLLRHDNNILYLVPFRAFKNRIRSPLSLHIL